MTSSTVLRQILADSPFLVNSKKPPASHLGTSKNSAEGAPAWTIPQRSLPPSRHLIKPKSARLSPSRSKVLPTIVTQYASPMRTSNIQPSIFPHRNIRQREDGFSTGSQPQAVLDNGETGDIIKLCWTVGGPLG
jgi:hypothetical protein